jgi:hypothetical protein
MRHWVRYSDIAHHRFRDQTFKSHENAIEFAENILKRYRLVWLLVVRISQMFHLGSARYRRSGDPHADELNQVTESEH